MNQGASFIVCVFRDKSFLLPRREASPRVIMVLLKHAQTLRELLTTQTC